MADSLLRALRDLGYIEGQNLVMEFRWAAGDAARLPDLADELARARVDAIMAFSTQGVRAAKRATATIPIVFVAGNPVSNGIVASLAHPEGNATGVALQVIGAVKASQILKDAVPKISRIVYLYDPRSTPPEQAKTLEHNAELNLKTAKALGLTIPPSLLHRSASPIRRTHGVPNKYNPDSSLQAEDAARVVPFDLFGESSPVACWLRGVPERYRRTAVRIG